MPERFIPTHFCRNSALQFRAFARHSICRLAGSIAIQLLVLIVFVFNPGDLYYLGYKKNNNNDNATITIRTPQTVHADVYKYQCLEQRVA